MIPKRYEQVLFVLILSCLMSSIVSAVSTIRAAGMTDQFLWLWSSAWGASWLVAFPIALLVVPVARRLVQRLVASH